MCHGDGGGRARTQQRPCLHSGDTAQTTEPLVILIIIIISSQRVKDGLEVESGNDGNQASRNGGVGTVLKL